MEITAFTADVFYLAYVVLGDVVIIAGAAVMAALWLFAVLLSTAWMAQGWIKL